MKSIRLLMLLLCLAPFSGYAQPEGESDEPGEGARQELVLGALSFPTSSESGEAQQAFIQGMLLLHLFEYPQARRQFIEAQRLDPAFVMAYWGEAMTYNHPIWDRQDVRAGRQALLKLGDSAENRLAMTPVAREKGLLTSLEILYGNGSKASRDRAYMRAMEQLAAQFPDDHEIQLFYALSIFGVHAGVRDVPSYMLATAISQSVFSENPQHPGAAHYLIHGVDDPVHAVLGLQAARALSGIAPDAAHAQHMTSHIFLAVGLWADVVLANERAVRVANRMRRELGEPARSWGHYNYWLMYGLLQQGRESEALDILRSAYAEAQEHGKSPEERMILDPDRSLVGSVVEMWFRYLIDTDSWEGEVADWNFHSGDAFDPNLTISFVRAMQAARNSLVSASGQFLLQFRALKEELQTLIERQDETSPGELLYLRRLDVMEQQLLAAIEVARGDRAAAVTFARLASDLEGEMPHSFGPPFVNLPSAEYLGAILLDSNRPEEAAEAFELQLERTRLRARSLEGLALAQERSGEEAEARYAREKLNRIRQAAGQQSADN